MSNIIVYKMT